MKTRISKIAAFVFVLLIPAIARPPAAAGATWTSYVDPSYMSEMVLRDGRLYIASTGGLLIYRLSDGVYEQYTNTIGLPSNYLTCLAFDDDGRLWVGTKESGIARLDETANGFEVTPLTSTFHGLADDRITDLAVWGDTLVYATESGAGLVVEGYGGARFFVRDGLPSDRVNAVLPDGNRVWMATDGGVVYLDEFGFLVNPTDTLFPAFALERTDSALWAGSNLGVAYLKNGAARWVHKTNLEAPANPVFSLRLQDDVLWAASRARLFSGSGGAWTQVATVFNYYIDYGLSIPSGKIKALQPMSDGALFFCGGNPDDQRRGTHLLRFEAPAVAMIPFDGLPMNRLFRLAFDIDESLWVATASFGVAKLTPSGEWFYYTPNVETNLSSRFANLTLLPDSQGSKWFCTLSYPASPSPLDELRDQLDTERSNDVWEHYTTEDGLGSLRLQDAAEDPEGNRWFLSDEDSENAPGWWGVSILSRDKSTWIHANPLTTGMQAGNVADVAFGANGVAYVALKKYGVQRWSTGGYDRDNLADLTDDSWSTIARIGTSGGIASGADVLSLALRSDGALWIGTTVGLYRYDGFSSLVFIPPDRGFGVGILGNVVKDLVLDGKEDLWVATDLGLSRIKRDNINDIASFTTPIVWQTQLNLFFPVEAVSPLVNADCERLALHPTKDLLYIATAGGLSVLDITFPDEAGGSVPSAEKAYLYPNPIEPAAGHSALKIGAIDSEVLVEIYTMEGELVFSVAASRAGQTVWDLTTRSGFLAASGVYLVRISGDGATVTRTVSLIR